MKLKMILIFTFVLAGLSILPSCGFQNDGDGVVWTSVDMTVVDEENSSDGPLFAGGSTATSLIIAVPVTSTGVSSTSYLKASDLDRQLLNLSNNTVSLTIPLNTHICLVKINFTSEYTLAAIIADEPEAANAGISEIFIITGDVTEKNITITMGSGSSGSGLIGEGVQGQTLSLSGNVTTLAGNAFGHADGTGIAAGLTDPHDICTDGTNIYVVDKAFNDSYIRKIVISTGVVTTLAGIGTSGYNDGPGASAQFKAPAGITINSTGDTLYIADQENNMIRILTIPTGTVGTLAGNTTSGTADGDSATARFDWPTGITYYDGYVYVADMNNHLIRKVSTSNGDTTTIAGDGTNAFLDHTTGTSARFFIPHDLTTDGTNLYVADQMNHRIRVISLTPPHAVTTLIGDGTDASVNGTGTGAQTNTPEGITTDGTFLYFTDWGVSSAGPPQESVLRKIEIATGITTFVAGGSATGGNCNGNDTWCYNGTGATAKFMWAHDLTTDGTYLYLADFYNHRIRRIE